MLEENGVEFLHRDPAKDPLSVRELAALFKKLGMNASELLRTRDKTYREMGLTGSEPQAELLALMSAHPGLMSRPIAVKGARAILARPPEKVLDL